MSTDIPINTDIGLIEGENIDCTLGNWENTTKCDENNYVVLTDKRLIYLNPDPPNGDISFIKLCNISSIDLETARMTSRRGYLWGGLALFASALLWQILDQPVVSVVIPTIVAIIGLYLIIDNRFSPTEIRARFKAGSATLVFRTCQMDKKQEVLNFINRIFQIRDRSADCNSPCNFSPRQFI